jgi:molecular chaperone GrpE (heat shock protein)/DNA-binding Xre family transcriptional regulator
MPALPDPSPNSAPDYTPQLRQLMQAVGLTSYQSLFKMGVSRQQIRALRRGEIQQLRLGSLLHLSQILGVSLEQFLDIFLPESQCSSQFTTTGDDPGQVETLKQEYQHLRSQMHQQQQLLRQSFQDETWQILESFFIQWPKAAQAARNHPQAPAVKLLPLLRPLEQLLTSWGIEPIGAVAATVNYDPHSHQLIGQADGTVLPPMLVKVEYVGYRQGDRLLRRAQVSPILPDAG